MQPESITIPLTQGKVAVIDAEDYERVSRFKWCAVQNKGAWYAARTVREPRTVRHQPGKNHLVYLHRFIMDAPPGTEVDHIHGDGLDNRKSELRVCSHKDNSRNYRLPRNNTSGFKGVKRARNKWQATIHYDGDGIYIGIFTTAEAAARAYDVKARDLFGKFANLNFPDED